VVFRVAAAILPLWVALARTDPAAGREPLVAAWRGEAVPVATASLVARMADLLS
jgi:hypothetical protein